VRRSRGAGVIRSHEELDVYKLAFEAVMRIFEVSKGFPREEVYSLTDQMRRSSRSVCANIAEAWRKRRSLPLPFAGENRVWRICRMLKHPD